MSPKLTATLRGALKSLTVWFSVLLAAAPEALPVIQSNFATIAPYIPDALESKTMHAIALAILLLRLRTTTALHEK